MVFGIAVLIVGIIIKKKICDGDFNLNDGLVIGGKND